MCYPYFMIIDHEMKENQSINTDYLIYYIYSQIVKMIFKIIGT